MRKAVLLQNVARPPDAFVGNPDRLVVATGKIGRLQKIVERLPVKAAPAGAGDLVVMVPLEALQIKEREGQFLDAGLNGIVSRSVFIVFLGSSGLLGKLSSPGRQTQPKKSKSALDPLSLV